MSRRQIVDQALHTLNQLPDEKVSEVANFALYILKKHEDTALQQGIQQLVETSSAFAFLHEEEDLYTVSDLKERFR